MQPALQKSLYPSRSDALLFRAKVTGLQLRRSWSNFRLRPPCYRSSFSDLDQSDQTGRSLLARSVTPLWTGYTEAEQSLIAGKIHNLRVAVQRINGIEIPAQGLFSFWAQLGRPSAGQGYVRGRELRQGCLIPSVGGGLCQLSNALYSAALNAGLEIVERHAHTQVIAGSLAEVGRDATVFWNYVDLRFRSPRPIQITAFLTATDLVVQMTGEPQTLPSLAPLQQLTAATLHSCLSCQQTACAQHRSDKARSFGGKTAYLVDEYWPEFEQYLRSQRSDSDLLCVPLDGQRWRKANYAWNSTGWSQVHRATLTTLQRALACRRLPLQGSSRQSLLLHHDAKLAQTYGDRLTAAVNHVVTTQSLLPFLWQAGHLGGRSFNVLMTRLPLAVLHQRLDAVHQRYPQSKTLGDFRVDRAVVEAETQALQAATQIITPHREIAALFPDRAVLLEWHLPPVHPSSPGNAILFPASTLGRKGAYELRTVATELGLTLTVLGQELEAEGFWQGVPVQRSSGNPLDGVQLVVLPAYVEHCPRLLLRAIAHQIPVIASAACGLGELPGVTTVPTGDGLALGRAIEQAIRTDSAVPGSI
jgi:VanW like protein